MIALGIPWMLAQSVAWLGMAVTYSLEKGSLVEGLSATFDGEHSCPLCKAVEKSGRETRETMLQKVLKLDAVLAGAPRLVTPAGVTFEHPEWRGCRTTGWEEKRFRPPRSGSCRA